MKSTNIDIPRLVHAALSTGAVTEAEIIGAVNLARNPQTRLKITDNFGHCRDEHGHLGSMFFATDLETGAIRRSKDGKRVRCNFRFQTAKRQNANTGAEVEQGQAGVPQVIDQATANALASMGYDVSQFQVQAQAAQAPQAAVAYTGRRRDFNYGG